MTLLLSPGQLEVRGRVVAESLRPLAESLRVDLAALCGVELQLPVHKARLTRGGGRCPAHGVLLAFDPWEPHRHRCPTCGVVFTGEDHDRWWVMNRQLWLAERAVHGAVLAVLTDDAAAREVAVRFLDACAGQYLSYPNEDNVLGPTRPFFSTYLESIWTLQVAVALDLLESRALAPEGLGGRVRDRVLAPSVELIASYDEGASNRQVWNNAALLACGVVLDREALVERAVTGRSGLVAHLDAGLLADGSWYEGENYHQFAHRGLWYGVTMAEQHGIPLPPALVARFHDAFALPFLTALPDFTFPARRDSQYAVSLRQWRFAESCELGLARTSDDRLAAALGTLYAPDVPAGDTGRATSTAEAERNGPPCRLDRSSLGWKSLLYARSALPDAVPGGPASVHLAHQGFAVFRRDGGRVYAALDYGHPGGGHGHPDRLNLWLVVGTSRFLEDVGTGSYTDPSLAWYRSTWAHNAPLVDGRSQPYGAGVLRGWGEAHGIGWVEATFELVPGRAHVTRRVIALDKCLIDEFTWESADDVELSLPWQVGWALGPSEAAATVPSGDLPSPMVALGGATVAHPVAFRASFGGDALAGWTASDDPFAWRRARAPGPPGSGDREITLWQAKGRRGRWRTVLAWGGVTAATFSPDTLVIEGPGGVARIESREGGCDLTTPDGRVHQLRRTSTAMPSATVDREPAAPAAPAFVLAPGRPFTLELSERHYRRSEQAWSQAGAPEATLRVAAGKAFVDIEISVRKLDPVFAPPRAANPLDNEDPDINSDGIQLYLDVPGANATGSWILVPEAQPHVRITPREMRGAVPPLTATWRLTPDGYQVRCGFPRGAQGLGVDRHFRLNVVINEISRQRERRRGQLVATGSDGEWVYLRGDREDPRRMLSFEIPDA
ncbi:MAG: heparinase II/III family protein [Gemmatimonadetes bacterium]|nr:heparinase II/III family protein [Gemmatimonadota bacterium]